jgi:hypothetical protein
LEGGQDWPVSSVHQISNFPLGCEPLFSPTGLKDNTGHNVKFTPANISNISLLKTLMCEACKKTIPRYDDVMMMTRDDDT